MATQTTNIPGSGYGNLYIDSLIWGDGWVGSPITYSFNNGYASSSAYGSFYGYTWSTSEKTAIASILGSYSAVCNVTFSLAANNSTSSNIAFWSLDNTDMPQVSGECNTPNATYTQNYAYFNWTLNGLGNLQPGGLYYEVLVHEIGHGLGLAHPHDGGTEWDATTFPGATAYGTGVDGLNQRVWTVMSYNAGYENSPITSESYGDASTPMAFDIAALQCLYGANYSYNTGNNVYVLDSTNGTGTDWSCIWDAGGIDTISNQSSWTACAINLNAAPLVGADAGGFISKVYGISGGYTIANGVVIENATGGYGNDVIIANSANNTLDGGSGDDHIEGGLGDDRIICGSGTDTVWYSYARSNYQISYTSGTYTVRGSEGTDTVTGVEYFSFSDQTVSAQSFIDTLAPTVTAFSPIDGATGVPVGSNIVVTFSEPIQKGTGTIYLRSGSATGSIIEQFDSATSTRLGFLDSTLTIDPTSYLSGNTQYFLTFAAGSVKDLAGNNYAGISTYDFRTAPTDTTAPTVVTYSPTDGSTNVNVTSDVVLTFSEPILRGAGTVYLRIGSSTGTIVEQFEMATSDRVNVSDSTLTIDPSASLSGNTHYFVTFTSGTIRDSSGNMFTGSSSYDFTTIGNNLIYGTISNDIIPSTQSNDQINGGPGLDTVVFSGALDQHNISRGADGTLTVSDINQLLDGTDYLTNVERLVFSDFNLALDTGHGENAGMAYRIYKAAFDRTPDVEGLGFWISALDQGYSLEQISNVVMTSPEFTQVYGSNSSNRTFVDLLYQHVLHRTADDEGFNFWNNALNAGYSRGAVLAVYTECPETIAMTEPLIAAGIQYQAI